MKHERTSTSRNAMQTDRLAIDLNRSPIHPSRLLTVMKVAFGAPRGAPAAEVECQLSNQKGGFRQDTPQWERRSRTLGLPYRRRQSAVFQRGGASQRPTVAPAGYANARFALAQNAQDSNRGVDTAGNLVNVG